MIFLEILLLLSSNVFITCVHICDMDHSGFLFDTILRIVLLIFKCLCLFLYCHAHKPLIYLLTFSFVVFVCFCYTLFPLISSEPQISASL